MIKKLYFEIRSKLYFLPVMYSLISIGLAAFVIYLDYNTAPFDTFFFIYTSRSLGSLILSTVVGSLLTMLTITFSIMMVVLTIYGSQLSPRSLQDFLEKKVTLRILGYFIGALIFSIISLFAVKTEQFNNYLLSPAIGVLSLIIAVIIFAYFVHYISKSVQITHYVHNLTEDIARMIDKDQKEVDDNPHINNGLMEEFDKFENEAGYEVKATRSGFIQYYEEEKLFEFAKRHNVIIACINMLGTHILVDDPLIKIFDYNNIEDISDVNEELLEMIYIGDEPNLYEDIATGTKKLVDIAVKALSPGINDPGTAVFCIEQLGYLLQKVAYGHEAKVYTDKDKNIKVLVQGLEFEQLLFQHFYQITQYGMKDLTILDAILGALIMICRNNSYMVKKQVWTFSRYLYEKIEVKNYIEYEKTYLKERFYQLSKASNQAFDLNKLFSIDE